MALIFFLLKLKINRFFQDISAKKLVFGMLLIISLIGNALVISEAIDTYVYERTSLEVIENVLIIGLCFFTLVSGFFPSYTPLRFIVAPIYPVSRLRRYIANVVFDVVDLFNVLLLLFFILLVISSEVLTFVFGIRLLVVFFAAYFFKRLLLLLFDQKWSGKKATGILGFVLVGIAVSVFFIPSLQFTELISFPGLLVASYILENFFFREKQQKDNKRSIIGIESSLWLTLLLKNKKIIIPIFVGMVFKFILLFIAGLRWSGIYEKENAAFVMFFIFLFSTPILIFTYVFNNIWGHMKTVWYAVEKASGSVRDLVKYYLKFLAPIILIDFSISLFFYILIREHFIENLILYFTSAFILITISLFASLVLARPISKVFSFSTNTNPVFSMISMGVIGSLYLVFSFLSGTASFYLIILLYLLVFGATLIGFFSFYPGSKETLFKKLFH